MSTTYLWYGQIPQHLINKSVPLDEQIWLSKNQTKATTSDQQVLYTPLKNSENNGKLFTLKKLLGHRANK